jgi:hypothetical protein
MRRLALLNNAEMNHWDGAIRWKRWHGRRALMAASNWYERIAAASINPAALIDELRKAIAVLQEEEHPSVSPPTKGRPVLRLIVGGLSS